MHLSNSGKNRKHNKVASKYGRNVSYINNNILSLGEIMDIINDEFDPNSIFSITRHMSYVWKYIKEFLKLNPDNNVEYNRLVNLLNNTKSLSEIVFTYINICNTINGINITIPEEKETYTDNICGMCNSILPSKEKECECGCINNIMKNSRFYGNNEIIYNNYDNKMETYLLNLTSRNIPKDFVHDYEEILDKYFIGKGKLIGDLVSSKFSSNEEKINNGYTLLNLYDALLCNKFTKPTEIVYFYARIYWDWATLKIDRNIIILCSDLHNIFNKYRISDGNIGKVSIDLCAWWLLNHFGIKSNYMNDFKRSKSNSDVIFPPEQFNILEDFSIKNDIIIPEI